MVITKKIRQVIANVKRQMSRKGCEMHANSWVEQHRNQKLWCNCSEVGFDNLLVLVNQEFFFFLFKEYVHCVTVLKL
jgi:hypothetical protein